MALGGKTVEVVFRHVYLDDHKHDEAKVLFACHEPMLLVWK